LRVIRFILATLAFAMGSTTVSLLAAVSALADDYTRDWPRAIDTGEWTVTIYEPQVDSFEGVDLEARAAVSVKRSDGGGEPAFGAVWLSAKVDIDREERVMVVRELTVPEVRFADSTDEQRVAMAQLLETEIPKWELALDLDRVVADLGGGAEYATTPGIRSDPPKFVHSIEPAVLLLYDGAPRTAAIAGAPGLESVVNTFLPVVREKGASTYYLFGGEKYWYSASDPLGPWVLTTEVPAKIRASMEMVEAPEESGEVSQEIAPPKIVVATEPTELIVTQGEPSWKPIGRLDLLYCDNTDADLFLDLSTQSYYVLASGRWYSGKSIDGEFVWTNVPNDQVPQAFSDIPEDSVNGPVLAHVAGTAQAREEALQNTIPQTAAVKRDDASLAVEYDGEPEFEPVEDVSEVRYAINTETPVFLANGRYWACDNAIWYVSETATGPWRVATNIPVSLYKIPASNPHHNVTYVHVYETTPQVVYVGYTPGYIGSYWYHGCVVWGTGWHYRPWYHHHYYHRPWTWGLNVRYSPYYGWSYGVTWTNGPFSIAWGWGGGYYGWGGYRRPPYHRPPYYRPYPRPGYTKPRPELYAMRPGAGGTPSRLPATGVRPGGATRPATIPSDNIYDRPAARDRIAVAPAKRDRARPARLDAPNDVLTDRSGNVYRPTGKGGWETRDQGKWRPAQGLDRPAQQPSPLPSHLRPSPSPSPPSRQPSARPSPQPSPRPSQQPSARPHPSSARPSPGATRPQLERDYGSRRRATHRVEQRPSPSRSPRSAPGARPSPRPRGGVRP